jgi:uncharacterized protein YlxW (UPF0749 family)
MIFMISAAVGLSLAAMSRGEWPLAGQGAGEMLRGGSGRMQAEAVARMAGIEAVKGPGIQIKVDDSAMKGKADVSIERLIVHERDLLMLRNELFSAGAEAVSINGLRMVANSVIRCVGPAIRLNEMFTTPPYTIKAVGDPETLKQAVMMMGGVVDVISAHGLKVDVVQYKHLVVPAYTADAAGSVKTRHGGAE